MAVPVVLVAAMARNRVIGAGNSLPWRMKSDMQQFRAATMGKPMVMGRKTFESIGRPLPGRRTIVVTRDAAYAPPAGVELVHGLDDALARAQEVAREMNADAVIVAGGAAIYEQALPKADRVILTELALDVKHGDAWFPDLPAEQWQELSRVAFPKGEQDDAGFDVVTWGRR